MKNDSIIINGNLLSTMGATLLSGGYSALMTPAPLKDFVENDDPLKDGVDVIVADAPRVKERDVTLTFLIQGADAADFMAKYAAFVAELHKGTVVLEVPDLGSCFHLLFGSCTQFDNYRLHACKVAVKFREPNPRNRTSPYLETPEIPDDADTTTDEWGISWYKKLFAGVGQVSAPLAIPDMASFSRNVEGQTIYYYKRNVISNILAQLKALYPADLIVDPVWLLTWAGISEQEPPSFRTVWDVVNNRDRGDVIVTYPRMGYYKNGEWLPHDTYFFIDDELRIAEVTLVDGIPAYTNLTHEDVAIPIKLLKYAEGAGSATAAMLAKMTGR
ncbi:MAG: hypothetical protein K2G66_04670 [Alistipes sp.]|nr:hypothetical protein [Alistipes sp.]